MKKKVTKQKKTAVAYDEAYYTTFEPKVSYRFICTVKDKAGETFIPSYIIVSCDRPRYYKDTMGGTILGRAAWEPISMELYDPISPNITKVLYDYRNSFKPLDVSIKLLGPCGEELEVWDIKDAVITSVSFGQTDWRAIDPMPINNTVQTINQTRPTSGVPSIIKLRLDYQYVTYTAQV